MPKRPKTIEEIKQNKTDAVVITTQEGVIHFVNQEFERLTGWSRNEIEGKPLTTIIPEQLRETYHLGISRFLVMGIPTLLSKPVNLKLLTKTRLEFDAEHFIIAEKQGDCWIFGTTLRPIGQDKP